MQLNWINYTYNRNDGYGRHGLHMVKALLAGGVQVHPWAFHQLKERDNMPGWMRRMHPAPDYRNLTIALMSAGGLPAIDGRLWGFSMYEADHIPAGWASHINRTCERFIVPSDFCAEVFKREGVTVPVHVIHEGIDPIEFAPVPYVPAHDDSFTFLCLGDRLDRKGSEEVWKAFWQTFPSERFPHVKLIIKGRDNLEHFFKRLNAPGSRTQFLSEDVRSMADIYGQADCFVYPSKGEGWGLPPREAAAMGIPTIASNWSGLMHGIDHYATVKLDRLHREKSSLPGEGYWMKADIEELSNAMLWVYENHQEAREKAQKASEWLHAQQTWRHAATQMIDLLEVHYGTDRITD